jgi:hypothetical protein
VGIDAGTDQRRHLDGIAPDGFYKIAQDAEAGDHPQRVAAHGRLGRGRERRKQRHEHESNQNAGEPVCHR